MLHKARLDSGLALTMQAGDSFSSTVFFFNVVAVQHVSTLSTRCGCHTLTVWGRRVNNSSSDGWLAKHRLHIFVTQHRQVQELFTANRCRRSVANVRRVSSQIGRTRGGMRGGRQEFLNRERRCGQRVAVFWCFRIYNQVITATLP